MLTATTKQQILETAGFSYSLDRRSYINRKARKVFSLEFIQDHTEGELQVRIDEPAPPTGEWCFYFNSPPSEAVKRELYAILG